MEVLVFYSTTQECFRCFYRSNYTYNSKLETLDYHGRYYVQRIVLEKKLPLLKKTQIKMKKYRTNIKFQLGKNLIKLGEKMTGYKKPIKKHSYQFWKR